MTKKQLKTKIRTVSIDLTVFYEKMSKGGTFEENKNLVLDAIGTLLDVANVDIYVMED